ncbi:unnamed protein product [Rotaria sordida]|uniref:Uncharacterized protein n=1 Tax=Rotaria sordida TaxID=392033 RepID=A0A819BZ13_9BILA|nr:unnamed protein product [Rotaria sordida]
MRLASTEPIEDTATKIRPLHTEHKYKCYIRTQNLAGLDEPSNAARETKIRDFIYVSYEVTEHPQTNMISEPANDRAQPKLIYINELTDTLCILSRKLSIRDNDSSIIEHIIEQRFKSYPSFTQISNEHEFRIITCNQDGVSAYSKIDRPIVIRASRQGISPCIEKFFNQTINRDSQDRIEATIIGSSKSEIIWYRKNHAIIDLFANSGIIFLCQTIRQDTDLYRLQVTN